MIFITHSPVLPTNCSPSAKHQRISPLLVTRGSSYGPRFQVKDVPTSPQKIILVASQRRCFIRKLNLKGFFYRFVKIGDEGRRKIFEGFILLSTAVKSAQKERESVTRQSWVSSETKVKTKILKSKNLKRLLIKFAKSSALVKFYFAFSILLCNSNFPLLCSCTGLSLLDYELLLFP